MSLWYRVVPVRSKRNKFNYLDGILAEPEVLILLGVRQAGKSTLMEDMMASVKKRMRKLNIFHKLSRHILCRTMSWREWSIL